MLSQIAWRQLFSAGSACSLQQGRPRSEWQRPPPLPPCRASSCAGQEPAAQPSSSSSDGGSPSTSSPSNTYEFTYVGSDGRLKATFEQAFKNRVGTSGRDSSSGDEGAQGSSQAPWALGYQMSERYSLLWNDELKARMLKRAAADELGIPDEELEERLHRLQVLLPDIRQKLSSMRPQLVARLAAEVEQLPARLLQLKLIFPGANSSVLAMRQPELVLGFDLARLEGIAQELRQMLPKLNIDLLVETNPSMLDVPGLQAAMDEAARIMPQLDVQQAMASDPQLIFSFQRGNQLIPYDPPRPEEPDEDEYGAYYG